MKRHRWQLLADSHCSRSSWPWLAAGCGGDDDETRPASGTTAAGRDDGRGRLRHRLGDGRLDRPRAGVVPGRPGRLRGGEPGRHRQLHLGRRPAADAALDRGRGWQPARRRGAAAAGPDARLRREGRAEAARLRGAGRRDEPGRVGGRARQRRRHVLYGFLFKAANKSTVWYNVAAFEDAGVEPPKTWDDFLAAAETINASGLPAYSIGGADGWTLTDLFENIYLRTAGPEKYDQLSTHEIPWTDQSVKDALTEMAKVLGDTENIAGGTSGALQTDFPTSVSNVFAATARRPRR